MTIKQISIARAETARCRAHIYDLLLLVFARLPEEAQVLKEMDDSFQKILETCYCVGGVRLGSTIEHIKSYLSNTEFRTHEEILNEIAVDRTRLIRATGEKGLKPPYECLYKNDQNRSGAALAVKNSYRKAGLLPDESVCELLDFLGVELDFMYQLCLREYEQWSSVEDAGATLADEEEFLREHLGSWVGEFCTQAKKYARTEFYRGFLAVLDAFISIDIEYLQSLTPPTAE